MTEPRTTEDGGTTTAVMPSRPWPVYNVSRARAEIIAMEMLLRGVSHIRIRHSTKLSLRNIKRLSNLIAEEGDQPPVPRNVCRNPIRSANADHSRTALRTAARTVPHHSSTEQLQMALALD